MIVKNQKHLTHLDMCPCMLTNKSILLINKYLTQNLKSLRFQNCCNWQLNSANQQQQNQQNAEQNQQQNYHQQNNDLNNDRLELRYFMDSDDDDDDDDYENDDDDDDDDEDDNDDEYLHEQDSQAAAEQRNEYLNLRPYFVNNAHTSETNFQGFFLFSPL